MIDHQRLSGLAYCYSASIPAMLAVSASEALRIMEQQPEMFDELSSRAHLLRQAFTQSKSLANLVYVEDAQEKNVPFFHIRILPGFSQRIIKEDEDIRETEERLLQQVVDECASQGVLVTRAKYVYDQEIKCPKPSIKLCATIGLSNKETDKSAQTVKAAIVKVFTKWAK
jgi:serine palmitoyltransferase